MLLRTFMIHGKRSKYQNQTKFGGSKLQPSCITLRGSKTSVEKVTADVMETEREQEFEAKPEHVTKLTQSHDKALTDEGFFLMDEQKRRCMKIVEMTTKGLEYYINLVIR